MDRQLLESYNKMINNQLQLYRYPFSVAMKYPKIPDGKEKLSIGLPFNYSKQLELKVGSVYCFVLFPGITSNLDIFQDSMIKYSPCFIQHFVLSKFYTKGKTFFTMDYTETGYGKYRYILSGLLMGVDSNHLQNGGLWEAIRLSISDIPRYFALNMDETGDGLGMVSPRARFFEDVDELVDWQNYPTYQSGRLKELGMFEFHLKDIVKEHDFVLIPNVVKVDTRYVSVKGEVLDNEGHNFEEFNFMVDKKIDTIVLRLKVFKNTSVSYHSSANIELVVDTNGNFNHFASENVISKSKLEHVEREIEKYHRPPGVLDAKYSKKNVI